MTTRKTRRVLVTGVGPVSGLGLGIDANWESLVEGRSAVAPVGAFDASAMGCPIAAEVSADFAVRDYVPKSYRKATKVMARDIELAVAAADLAARDAGLVTPGTDPDAAASYAPERIGCHIGAGLIAADLDELTAALVESSKGDQGFDIHHWGSEGMKHLTPLWLLKYLPNMLACHVTIIHDTRGPSNTITCGEASGGLSIGESLRVIQRGHADLCFCGGAESKLNPMAYLRQVMTGRLVSDQDAADPVAAVRPFDREAKGGALGEGGGIVTLEAAETFAARGGKDAYAEMLGFGASQTVNPAAKNREPNADGRGIVSAVRAALREAQLGADEIDVVIPFGLGHKTWDAAEAAALRTLFGERLSEVPVLAPKASVGNTGAGSGGYDLCLAAKVLRKQTLPPITGRPNPLPGLTATTAGKLDTVLVFATGLGGQNTAIVLRKV